MEPVSLFDMEAMAKLRIPHDFWDYVAGGAADEITYGGTGRRSTRSP